MDQPHVSAATSAQSTIQHHHSDLETSSPRSRNAEQWHDEPLPCIPGAKLRLMCSYGGHIMPRPHDKSLSYIGGDTRIVVVDRHSSLKELCSRLSRTILNGRSFTLKYQLPNEDLDNLITVTTDEDLDNMIEEYDRAASKPSPARLRVFLFFNKPEATLSMGSLLDDAKSETWFVDALNNSGILSRVVSDSAAVDNFVNLDGVGVSASGSSNNLEAQGGAESLTLLDINSNNNNKIKNLPDVLQTSPGSPMVENSSSSSSPSMANLPPIRVRVDDSVSRLQQENKVGVVVEEQFSQMTIGATSGMKNDDGFGNVVSSAVALPSIPVPLTMTSVGVVATSDVVNRIVSDDERSDHGAPTGFRKPPLPLQLVQPRTCGGGLSLPSPDSVASDNSIASSNSFSKHVYYQEQVQAAPLDNKPVALQNAKSEISDHVLGLQREQVQDSGYTTLPTQMDQNQQLQQLVHASTHYIHHPAATNPVPVSSYYQVYAPPPPQQHQQQLHPPIGQQQYPVYVMPVGHTQPYNMALQPNITDPNVVPSGRPLLPQSVVTSTTYKDGTPPIYPTKSATPTLQEVTQNVYKPPVASNPAFVPIPPNQFQPQYVVPQFHHPPQSIAVAPSNSTTNYAYEYGTTVPDQTYYTQQQTNAQLLPPQYQSMTPAAAAAALSDASKQFPAENIQQPNRTSQPV